MIRIPIPGDGIAPTFDFNHRLVDLAEALHLYVDDLLALINETGRGIFAPDLEELLLAALLGDDDARHRLVARPFPRRAAEDSPGSQRATNDFLRALRDVMSEQRRSRGRSYTLEGLLTLVGRSLVPAALGDEVALQRVLSVCRLDQTYAGYRWRDGAVSSRRIHREICRKLGPEVREAVVLWCRYRLGDPDYWDIDATTGLIFGSNPRQSDVDLALAVSRTRGALAELERFREAVEGTFYWVKWEEPFFIVRDGELVRSEEYKDTAGRFIKHDMEMSEADDR